MCILGAQALSTIAAFGLCDHRDDCKGDSEEAILEHQCPNDVEPGQSAPWFSPWSFPLAPTAGLEPAYGREPVFHFQIAEIDLLALDIGGDIIAQEPEE